MLLGVFALSWVGFATLASILTIGVVMIVAGISHVVLGFSRGNWKSNALLLLAGAFYLLAGGFVFVNPLLASSFLTLTIALFLQATGAIRIWFGFKRRSNKGWIALVLAGVVTLLLGLVIAAGWPVNSLWIIGMFLAIDLLIQGVSYLTLGLALRSHS